MPVTANLEDLPSELASRVEVVGGCWEWRGAVHVGGYGTFRRQLAHRLSYVHFHGDVAGLDVHHTCRNRRCINPAHLEAVTRTEHRARHPEINVITERRHAAIGTCPRGHPLDAANTVWYEKDGYRCRTCRACMKARSTAARKTPTLRIEDAMAWLGLYLADGPRPIGAESLAEVGVSRKTLERAKAKMGVRTLPGGPGSGKGGKLYALP